MNGPVPLGLIDRLRVPGYVILVSAMVLPLIDLAFLLVPVQAGTISWRFGAVGLFSSTVGGPLLLLFLFYAFAVMLEDRTAVIVAMAVAAVLALVLIVSVGSFSLDGIEMKARVQPQAQSRFVHSSIQALGKLLFQAVAATVLAVSALRGIRQSIAEEPERSRGSASLLVARRGSTRPARASGGRDIEPASADAPTNAEPPNA